MDPWRLFHAIAFIVAEAENLSRDFVLRGNAYVRVVWETPDRQVLQRVWAEE
jgi:hypothetical protein